MSKIQEITARIQAEQNRENRIREAQDILIDQRREEITREARERDEQRQQHYGSQHYDSIVDMLDDKAREIVEATRSRLQEIQERRELEDYRREIDRQREEQDKARPEREINEYATQLVKIEERRDDRGNVEYTASRGDEQVTGRSVQEAAQLLDAAEQERRMNPLTAEEQRQALLDRRAELDREIAAHRAQQDAKSPPTPEVLADREREDRTLASIRNGQDKAHEAQQARERPQDDRDDRGR